MLRKIALLALSLLIIVSMLAVAACGSDSNDTDSESTSPVSQSVAVKDIVPQNVNLIAGLSLDMLGDQYTQESFDEAIQSYDGSDFGMVGFPETYDELLQMVQDKTGLDIRDINGVVVFANIPATISDEDEDAEDVPYVGAVVSGTFKQDEMVAAIENSLGHSLNAETYDGHVIYAIQSEGLLDISESDAVRMAFLSEANLVIGTDQVVKDVIDVNTGNEQGLSGELLNLYEGIDDAYVRLALEIQKEWLSGIPDEQALPGFGQIKLGAFKNMRMATLAIDQDGDAAVADVEVDFSNGSSANDAKDTIDSVLSLFQGLMKMTEGQGDSAGLGAITKLLDSLKLSVSETWLKLHLEITTEQVEELMPLFQGMFSELMNED